MHRDRIVAPEGGWRAAWPRAPALVRYLTILLPALLVGGAEIVRHEWLHDVLPVMAGNLVTAAIALGISALVLVPLYRRLEASDAHVRRLEIERAVAGERERIARELHDGISQALFFLNVKATALAQSLSTPEPQGGSKPLVGEISQAIEQTAGRVRDAIFDLRTGPEPGQPFAGWVRAYAKRFGEAHALEATVEESGRPLDLPLDGELHAMAIVREALHNIAKHARAHSVRIRIEWRPGGATIAVEDDGRGLPDPLPGPPQGRYGLAALYEHAEAAGGHILIAGGSGRGTSIVLRIPCSEGRPRDRASRAR